MPSTPRSTTRPTDAPSGDPVAGRVRGPRSEEVWPADRVFVPPTAATLGLTPRQNAIRDVMREVLTAISGLSLLGPKLGLVWRGHADATWRLESTIVRAGKTVATEILEHEKDMIRRARLVGADGAQHLSDWEVLARLRHHGAATRLIDVTADPYVALWFAAAEPGKDGLILAISRSALHPLVEPWNAKYDDYAIVSDGASYLYRVAAIDPRISAQRGLFVFSSGPKIGFPAEMDDLISAPATWSSAKLEKICGGSRHAGMRGRPIVAFPAIIGVRVPSAVKTLVREFLERSFGYTVDAIFPDFPGLGEANSLAPFK
jgi:hypothetical protein